jgi:hypothetical protein
MAEITITATDTGGGSHPVTEQTVDDSSPLSGEGSTGGSASASTSKTEPNSDGDKTTTNQTWKPKAGSPDVTKVEITVKRSCPEGKPNGIILAGSGNISVSARVDGVCIYVTEVNSSVDPTSGVVKTVTTNKKKCCGQSDAAARATSPLGNAEHPAIQSASID